MSFLGVFADYSCVHSILQPYEYRSDHSPCYQVADNMGIFSSSILFFVLADSKFIRTRSIQIVILKIKRLQPNEMMHYFKAYFKGILLIEGNLNKLLVFSFSNFFSQHRLSSLSLLLVEDKIYHKHFPHQKKIYTIIKTISLVITVNITNVLDFFY